MFMTITFISFMISFIFTQINHPLAMGLTLLIQTFLICMMSSIYIQTFWYSYILFLIFMGGMLVLFIYVTSLSSNEMFSMSIKMMIMSSLIFSIYLMLYFFIDKMMLETFLNNFEMNLLTNFKNLYSENILSLNKMYNFPMNMITLLLINYLFLTLLMSVKITMKNYGPLRPMY
uniref:NADH-ubiquinone oxidoreductase chain 6 n=1 Tax=Toxorhynchites speciosus TaxID=2681096 RepID=A0A7T0CNL8_9DIPT|nr:NADH dehydrogenase subunit 6 [Toxorhynchites speciosus]QPJ78653.1 NADH dehydrogenase subunit 6 [Toxorhynchites speciosus]